MSEGRRGTDSRCFTSQEMSGSDYRFSTSLLVLETGKCVQLPNFVCKDLRAKGTMTSFTHVVSKNDMLIAAVVVGGECM